MEIQFNGTGPVMVDGHGKTYPGDICDLPDDQAQAMLDTRSDWSTPGGANLGPVWPLKSTPEEYLQKTPDGPKADLAREILNNEKEE